MDVSLIPLPAAGSEAHTIPGGQCLVGRGEDCDLQLTNQMVSRHHAELSVDDDSLRLRDLESLNGTFVNGDRIDDVRVLEHGDVVAFGMASFEIRVCRTIAERIRRRLNRSPLLSHTEDVQSGSDHQDQLVAGDGPVETPALQENQGCRTSAERVPKR